jgi:hypothetical protein
VRRGAIQTEVDADGKSIVLRAKVKPQNGAMVLSTDPTLLPPTAVPKKKTKYVKPVDPILQLLLESRNGTEPPPQDPSLAALELENKKLLLEMQNK